MFVLDILVIEKIKKLMKKYSLLLNVPQFVIFTFLLSGFSNSQTFTKITTGAFVNDGGASRSVNFIDYDNDGDLDLYVTNGKRYGQYCFLYNNTGGIFSRVLGAGPVNDSLPFDGSSWADFDNDGDADLAAITWYDSTGILFKNEGAGLFTFLSSSPIVTDRGFSETCSWGDYDNDGLVDIFVTNSDGIGTYRNRLYKNTGSGNFTRIDSGAIYLDVNKPSRCVNWVDIDGDRDMDLFVTTEGAQDEMMYINNGGGYFTKVSGIPPVMNAGETWSSSWGDYDNDGDFDVFLANWNAKNALFRNDGNFTFTKILNDTMVNETGRHAVSGWGDYDNDGDLDMFVTQAYTTPNAPLNNKLYKNRLMETGTASFEKITTGDIVNDGGYSYGFAWGDWDTDGDLDIFVAKTYSENENNAAFLNNGNANSWLEIKLQGNPSNKSGIGAKVRIRAVINGNPVWLSRAVEGQSGYCGENLDLHFGLGNSIVVDTIRVEWPSSTTQVFTGIAPNHKISIDENTGIIGLNQNGTEVPEGFDLKQNYPNPFNPSTKIEFDINQTGFVLLKVYDLRGRELKTLVSKELKAGSYSYSFNGGNLSSGVYFYSLISSNNRVDKKMMLIK